MLQLAAFLKIASLVTEAVSAGVEVATAVQRGHALIGIMVNEGRDPTPAEYGALRDEITTRGDRIQNAPVE